MIIVQRTADCEEGGEDCKQVLLKKLAIGDGPRRVVVRKKIRCDEHGDCEELGDAAHIND